MPAKAQQRMSPKYYLATYIVIDGNHEHSGHLLIIAFNEEEARSFAGSLTHDYDSGDGCDYKHPWSYGDGTTASKLSVVREVSAEQFNFVKEAMASLVYDTKIGHMTELTNGLRSIM
jgi:hypothetical protein